MGDTSQGSDGILIGLKKIKLWKSIYNTKGVIFTIFFFFGRRMQDLSSLTRDRTCTPCLESMGSYPLDHQGSPSSLFLSV